MVWGISRQFGQWTKDLTPETCEAELRAAVESPEDTPYHPLPTLVTVVSLLDRIAKLEQNMAELNTHQHQIGDPTGRHSSLPCTGPWTSGGK